MGRRARNYTTGPAIQVQLKLSKKLKFDVTGGRLQALQVMAQMAGKMLHDRIERGVQWDGKPTPRIRESEGRSVGRKGRLGKARYHYFFVHKDDPRTASFSTSAMRPWNMKGQKGPPQWLVFRGSYAEFKSVIGKKQGKGSSFTGQMWRSLTGSVRDAPKRAGGGGEIRLYFAGSSPSRQLRPGGRGATERFRNRDKARLLQYAGRSGVGSGENATGAREFEMMRFSSRELEALAGAFVARVRLT